MRALRDLGMGKSRLEDTIQNEAEMLIKYLNKLNLEAPVGLDLHINVAALNVIWQMSASMSYCKDADFNIFSSIVPIFPLFLLCVCFSSA